MRKSATRETETVRREAPAPRLTWGIQDAAKTCGVSASFIRKQITEGKLKIVRLGRRVMIKDTDLWNWVNSGSES